MEIEKFWIGLSAFKNNEKGQYGYYDYGYNCNHRSKCLSKTYRQHKRSMRKYGFDLSEIWSLDTVFMRFMSDTYHGFWQLAGNSNNWGCYDLDGNYYDFIKYNGNKEYIKKTGEYELIRCKSYLNHLKDFFDNATIDDYKVINPFIIPRLKLLYKTVHGFPEFSGVKTMDEWKSIIQEIITGFENNKYSDKFIDHFFDLWD